MDTRWKGDSGLNARMVLSFVILGILYIIFLSILHYLGVGYIPLAIIASAMILAQWYFSDKIVLWSSRATIVSKEQYPRLHEIVERLSTNNGIPKPKVAIVNSVVPNAFATGKSPKSSLVAVTSGILDLLDDDELEAVIGHELSHVRSGCFSSNISQCIFYGSLVSCPIRIFWWIARKRSKRFRRYGNCDSSCIDNVGCKLLDYQSYFKIQGIFSR